MEKLIIFNKEQISFNTQTLKVSSFGEYLVNFYLFATHVCLLWILRSKYFDLDTFQTIRLSVVEKTRDFCSRFPWFLQIFSQFYFFKNQKIICTKFQVLLSLMGILVIVLALGASFGFCFYMGIFFADIHPVIPFLLLGIGNENNVVAQKM